MLLNAFEDDANTALYNRREHGIENKVSNQYISAWKGKIIEDLRVDLPREEDRVNGYLKIFEPLDEKVNKIIIESS